MHLTYKIPSHIVHITDRMRENKLKRQLYDIADRVRLMAMSDTFKSLVLVILENGTFC